MFYFWLEDETVLLNGPASGLNLLQTNISPQQGIFLEDDFPFPQGGYGLVPCQGILCVLGVGQKNLEPIWATDKIICLGKLPATHIIQYIEMRNTEFWAPGKSVAFLEDVRF